MARLSFIYFETVRRHYKGARNKRYYPVSLFQIITIVTDVGNGNQPVPTFYSDRENPVGLNGGSEILFISLLLALCILAIEAVLLHDIIVHQQFVQLIQINFEGNI